MLPYISMYSILALLSFRNYKGSHNLFYLIFGLLLVWFMGFRFETGCDWYGYLNRWNGFQIKESVQSILLDEEIGFSLLVSFVKISGGDYIWHNVLISLVLVFLYIRFASQYVFSPIILTLFFPVIVVQLGMSGVRQALAGAFLMLSFNAFARGEKLWTAVWILVAAQFHASAAAFFPIAVLAGREITTVRLAAGVMLTAPVVAFLLGTRIDTYEDRYSGGEVVSNGAVLRYLLLLIPVPFALIYRKKLKNSYPDLFPLLWLSALVILSLLPLVFLSTIALHRIGFYIFPLSILLLACLAMILFRKPSHGFAISAGLYGLYSLSWFSLSKHAQICYVPYQNTWLM